MSILKKSLISVGVAASLLAMSGAHASAYFTINGGYGTSASFNVLSSNVDATSVYTSPVGPVASFDSLIGIGAFVTDTSAGGQVNSFLNGTTALLNSQTGGFLSNYRLLFSYQLNGTAAIVDGMNQPLFMDGTMDYNHDGLIDSNVTFSGGRFHGGDAIVPNYTTGTITITYQDLTGAVLGAAGNTQEVLQLDLVSATPDGTNVILNANVDYSWYADGTSALVENMFHFAGDSASWYDLWSAGAPGNPIAIRTRSDFNIDPNALPTSTCGEARTCNQFARTTNLNITTTVPEPGTLALLGVGLLGLGLGAARNMRKA